MKRPYHRRGVVLAFTLGTLFAIVLFGGVVLRSAVLELRSVRTSQGQNQAYWLAQSGLSRAYARWLSDPDYSGETWLLPAETFGARRQGEVRIRIVPVPPLADAPEEQRVRILVEARFGVEWETGWPAHAEEIAVRPPRPEDPE